MELRDKRVRFLKVSESGLLGLVTMPSQLPVVELDVVVDAIQVDDDIDDIVLIVPPTSRAVLDKGDKTIEGHHYIVLPGDGCREQVYWTTNLYN